MQSCSCDGWGWDVSSRMRALLHDMSRCPSVASLLTAIRLSSRRRLTLFFFYVSRRCRFSPPPIHSLLDIRIDRSHTMLLDTRRCRWRRWSALPTLSASVAAFPTPSPTDQATLRVLRICWRRARMSTAAVPRTARRCIVPWERDTTPSCSS